MQAALRTPGFAETYERVLVPSCFAPWAAELIERARPIGPSDRILDLGCGTGIVARTLRERLGGGARLTGVDASPDMIAMARRLAPQIAWHEGNALALPFPDASFELVVCQQMLQFVPDRAAALGEVRRVLVPGGRLVAATWRAREEQPFFDAIGRIAEQHLGRSAEKRFSFGDEEALSAAVAGAGFGEVRVEIVARTDRYLEFPFRQSALAANFDLTALSDAEREAKLAAIEAECVQASRDFADGAEIAAPTRANLVTAVAK